MFEELRALRSELAHEHNCPPFMIFHDSTLTAIAQMRPTTTEALYEVPGMGERKVASYGDAVLEIINGF